MVLRPALLSLGVALLALTPAAASAARPQSPKLLRLSAKKSFAGNEPFVVRWTTDRALPKGLAYKVTLMMGGTPERDGPACTSPSPQIVRRVGSGTPRGRRLTVVLPVPKSGRWCPNREAGISVEAPGVFGLAKFSVRDSRGLLPPEGYFWGRMTFAPSSSITIKVPGRPDRTAPITAQVDQDSYAAPANPYRFLGTTVWVNSTGTVTPGALAADPLCTAAPLGPIAVDRATTLVLPGASLTPRPIELTLVLRAGASALTGCGPDGAEAGTTAVVLKSDPSATGPAALRLTGSVDGVRLAGGAVASVALDVTVGVPAAGAPASS